MNIIPEPRERPLWQRLGLMIGILVLAGWKFLRLPRSLWFREARCLMENWTWGMFGVVLKSFVTRAYIDQPCRFVPVPLTNSVSVAPEYRLSPEEIQGFNEKGFIGPFDAFPLNQVKRNAIELLWRRKFPSRLGIVTDRDRHFDTPVLLEMMRHPAILERAAQLLGPDLLCWRSQIFLKEPGGKAIQWHQASTYMMEDYLEPALQPPDRNQLFQLTVWIALDDATIDNGCMKFIPGSHNQIRTIRFGGGDGFYHVSFRLEFDHDPAKEVSLEMKAGQFIIFSERTIHGTGPNITNDRRMAVNFRLIPPTVKAYAGGSRVHRAMHMGQQYSLDNWGALLMRGEDRYKLNKMVDIVRTETEHAAAGR